MPQKIVKLPDGKVVAFPDGMSDADISAAIQRGQPPQQVKPQSPTAQQIFNKPANLAMSGLQEIGQGNLGVGGTRLARAGASFIPSVYGGATQGIRELGQASGVPIVNELAGGLAGALEIPGYVIGGVTNMLSGASRLIGDPIDRAIGTDKPSPYAQELRKFADEFAPYALGPAIFKGAQGGMNSIAKSVAERPTRLFKKEVSRVAPPKAQELGYKQSLERSIPYLEQEIKRTPIDKKQPESQFQQATDIVTNAKNRLWQERVAPQIVRHKDAQVSGDAIARSVDNKISFYLKEAEPSKRQAMQEYADRFRGKTYTLAQAQELIQGLNAEMRNLSPKTPEAKVAIAQTDPLMSAREAAADALRDTMIRTLSERGEAGVKELRQDYGALRQIQDALRRNVNKAELAGNKPFGDLLRRHSGTISIGLIGEMVGHQLGLPIGTFGPALIALKETAGYRAQPNVTISRAFKRLEKGKFPARPTVELETVSPRALLGQGAIPLGPGGKDTFTIRTGPVSAVPDVSLSKPRQLGGGPIRLRESGPTEILGRRIEDLQWNPRTKRYEYKPSGR